MAGDDFLKLLESLLDCDGEEAGGDAEPVNAEALKVTECTPVAADGRVLSY